MEALKKIQNQQADRCVVKKMYFCFEIKELVLTTFRFCTWKPAFMCST